MTIRKRKTPTPGFGLPPPWNPLTGEHADLAAPKLAPHCAMMQVAVEDTHDNYVICRGYDPRIKKFFDYVEAVEAAEGVEGVEGKPGIPVAKPWSNRTAGAYTVGQIFPAVIPLTRIGQTPGVRDPGEDEEDPLLGQPEDLDEDVEILYTEDGKVINWLLIDSGSHTLYEILDLWPQWDDDEKAYKIQARIVPDEQASGESFDVDAVDDGDKEWLWFPREWSWENGNDSEFPTITRYQRVYGIARNNRKEIQFPAGFNFGYWITGVRSAFADSTCPPYGCGMIEWTSIQPNLNYGDTGEDEKRRNYIGFEQYKPRAAFGSGSRYSRFVLNGSLEVPTVLTPAVPMTYADRKPAWALAEYALSGDGNEDDIGGLYGPAFDSWKIWPGLPGFRRVLPRVSSPQFSTLIQVEAEMGGVYAGIATGTYSVDSNTSYYILVHPMASHNVGEPNSLIYDGRVVSGVTVPDMTIAILLLTSPLNPTKTPNIQEGDIIWYRVAMSGANYVSNDAACVLQFLAVGDYWDDPIGTVNMWIGAVENIPRGWRVFGADGNFIRVDNSSALGTGTFGAAGGNYDYQEVRLIERFE